MGSVCFGFATSVVNGALEYMAKPSELNLNAWQQGVLSSGLILGAAFGAIFGGPLGDKIGRRKEMLWLGAIFTVFGIGCALAPNAITILIMRFIMGLAVGAVSSMIPVYLGELSPTKTRGKYVSMHPMSVDTGQFLIFLINSIFASTIGAQSAGVWRWMLGVIAVPGLILWLGMYFAPESPRWYANHGKFGQALNVLYKIRSKAQAEKELEEIKENIKKSQAKDANKASFKDINQGWIWQLFVTGAFLCVFQQFSGINSLMYYGTKVLEASGFGGQTALWMNVANGIFSIVGAVIALFIVDKVGRKPLMLFGEGFCAVAFVLAALIGNYAGNAGWKPWAILVILLLFIIVFQGTLGSVTWLYISEIFPARFRGLGAGVATFSQWIANFIVSLLFPQILAIMGMSSFYIFAIFCALGFWFYAVRLPETKGVPLEQVVAFFRERYDKNYNK